MQAPVIVVNTTAQRESGRKAQLSNILAAKSVADVIRSCLGPSSMLKMLMDPMGGIVLTNDGHAILREIEVGHPAAKSMLELSRTQDEEVGDGTTSVIILAGEILDQCKAFLEKNVHPIVIIGGLRQALQDALFFMQSLAVPVSADNDATMKALIHAAINTKFAGRYGDLVAELALSAVRVVAIQESDGRKDIDVKRYVRIEKIPGDSFESSSVLRGILLNKDVTHPAMRRRIVNPKIILLDCSLEYKKGESQTNLELSQQTDWQRILAIEEEQVKSMVDAIVAMKPDLVITEKGISDLAQHYFVQHNITALRRVKKMDSMRLAKATGATIVSRPEDLKLSDIGTKCGLFRIDKIGDEYFSFIEECEQPRACTIILRGPSKDLLNELERDLQDALCVTRNLFLNPKVVPGGGATEMAVAVRLDQASRVASRAGSPWLGPYRALAESLLIIPKTLLANCGANVLRSLTELRAKHATALESQDTAVAPNTAPSANIGNTSTNASWAWAVDGISGNLFLNTLSVPGDQTIPAGHSPSLGIWEPLAVKTQTLQTAIEACCMLLRVDDIVSGVSAKKSGGQQEQQAAPTEDLPQND